MKRTAVVVFLVAVLVIALSVPALALENVFGGYFCVRPYMQHNFDGVDDSNPAGTAHITDSRTRLYYTAILHENLKFVSKFEMDAWWGWQDTGYVDYDNDGRPDLRITDSFGDLSSDGVAVEVKNLYIDFNLNTVNVKLGTQGAMIQRGFIMANDFSGLTVSTGGFTGTFIKAVEGLGNDNNDEQVLHGRYAVGMDTLTITPNLTYIDAAGGDYLYFIGADIDGSAGAFSYWGSLIYNGGKGVDFYPPPSTVNLIYPKEGTEVDYDAFLVAAGAGMDIGDWNLHIESFHATGDKDENDDEYNRFQSHRLAGYTPTTEMFVWAEIMGLGILDAGLSKSNGSCGGLVADITAANVGVDFKASEKLVLRADVWWAQKAEKDDNGEKYLGTEIDLTATYNIMASFDVDLVAAYLFAGDATTGGVDNPADPYELGAVFRISF